MLFPQAREQEVAIDNTLRITRGLCVFSSPTLASKEYEGDILESADKGIQTLPPRALSQHTSVHKTMFLFKEKN